MSGSKIEYIPMDWPKATDKELGCPECGTLVGEQDDGQGGHEFFCPKCSWKGQIE